MDGSGQRAEFMTKKDAVVTEEPLVVWVDGGSASSSEVLCFFSHWSSFPRFLLYAFCQMAVVLPTLIVR